MLNKNSNNKGDNMLQVINSREFLNNNNERVAEVTLADGSVFTLTDFMFVDFETVAEMTVEELADCGWEKS
mgnify:FL=1